MREFERQLSEPTGYRPAGAALDGAGEAGLAQRSVASCAAAGCF